MPQKITPVSFMQALKVWLKIAALSFGGPAGQIAVIHRILVDEKKWLSENRFLHALSYCTLLPGPEAMQLMTYSGWMMFGIRGGLTAGLLFVFPGFISILVLSLIYGAHQNSAWLIGGFLGIKSGVIAIVIEALLRIGKRVLKNKTMFLLAIAAFTALFFFRVSFPFVILCAGLIGLIGARFWPKNFYILAQSDIQQDTPAVFETLPEPPKHFLAHTLKTLFIWCFIWFLPVLGLAFWLGKNHILVQQGIFFSKTAVVTFGGAYSVLSYIAQETVQNFGWLSLSQMIDGLGLAETTPGPLIQVVQFVGFLGAFHHSEPFTPWAAGLWASVIATWVTYAPCFLWIFWGAPYVEKLRTIKALSCALSAITAAVVGVILNLTLWFALHTLFGKIETLRWNGLWVWLPQGETFQIFSATLALIATVALLKRRIPLLAVLAGCVITGMGWKIFF